MLQRNGIDSAEVEKTAGTRQSRFVGGVDATDLPARPASVGALRCTT
jgi:hypothetical protein